MIEIPKYCVHHVVTKIDELYLIKCSVNFSTQDSCLVILIPCTIKRKNSSTLLSWSFKRFVKMRRVEKSSYWNIRRTFGTCEHNLIKSCKIFEVRFFGALERERTHSKSWINVSGVVKVWNSEILSTSYLKRKIRNLNFDW